MKRWKKIAIKSKPIKSEANMANATIEFEFKFKFEFCIYFLSAFWLKVKRNLTPAN